MEDEIRRSVYGFRTAQAPNNNVRERPLQATTDGNCKKRPYLNTDVTGTYRQMGTQRASGFEFFATGEIIRNLNVVAGAVLGGVNVTGSAPATTILARDIDLRFIHFQPLCEFRCRT